MIREVKMYNPLGILNTKREMQHSERIMTEKQCE